MVNFDWRGRSVKVEGMFEYFVKGMDFFAII